MKIRHLFFSLVFVLPLLAMSQERAIFKEEGVIYNSSFAFHNGHFGISDIPKEGNYMHNNNSIYSLHQSVGYLFNPYFSAGVGLGFEKWRKTSFIPIYADLRFNIFSKRYSPQFMINLGYSNKWYESPCPEPEMYVIHGATEGLFMESGVGLRVWFKKNRAGTIIISYKIQESDLKYSDEFNFFPQITTNQTSKVLYHHVGIRIGMMY